jgi:uncharacterized protein (DUF1800 family)
MNRRNFFTLGVAPLRTGNAGSPPGRLADGTSQNPPAFLSRTEAGLEPFVPTAQNPFDYAKAAHLLGRCVIGPTDAEIRKAVADGLDATITALLQPFTPTTDEISDWAGQDPQIRPDSTSQTDIQAFQDSLVAKRQSLSGWWLRVMATSPLSIQERMVLFWHNHFTSEMQVVQIPEWMYGQNQLLRSHALGNLKQFVKDVTKDMAMLVYLDGAKNFKTGNRDNINENYARELQELFTMGVVDWNDTPNYTQTDVHEAARSLSGYSVTSSTKGTQYAGLASAFVQSRWDSGTKTFLGKTGTWKTDDVVDIIFSERADQVAKFVCEKIYRAFVYDVPDRTIVAAMADTLRSGNWEIRPVMVQLLKSAHFFDVTNIGALETGPVEFCIRFIRSLGLTSVPDFTASIPLRQQNDLKSRLTTLGQTIFDPPNVKGWPGGRTWISTSTAPVRQKFTLDTMDGKIKGTGATRTTTFYQFDPIAFAKQFPSPNQIQALSVDMASFLLPTSPSEKEAQMLLDTIVDGGASYDWNLDDPSYKAADRITKYLKALFQLAKYQLY